MGPGVMLLGISAVATIFGFRHFTRRRSAVERRLAALGFKRCDSDGPALERAWRTVTRCNPSRELHVADCRGRIAGLGMMHHFTVLEQPQRLPDGEPGRPGRAYPAYLLDLRNAASLCRGALTLHVAPPTAKITGKAAAGGIDFDDARPSLDVGTHPWSASIVAAHSEKGGRLDDLMPTAIQEKLVQAAAHGFCTIHVGNGKAAFATRSNHEDVEEQMAYLAEWL